MYAQFDTEKNKKAFLYTVAICLALLLMSFLIRWKNDLPPAPLPQDLIEINLGNNAEGFGKVQPLIKGKMSEKALPPENSQQSKTATSVPSETKNVQADEDDDKDAAAVNKSVKKTVKKNNPAAIYQPAPKVQRPVATYNGPGNGKGNGATENGYRYQGNNPNGKGDAGDPSGNPDSYGNSLNGKIGGGISFPSNLRHRYTQLPSFTDDFNKNAKVYVAITVDASGNVSSASIVTSTTDNPTIKSIALQKAKQIKFKPGDEDSGTIVFNFRVQN
jgi:TonB family protein